MIKRKVEDWTVEKLNKERPKISFPEYQREKSLWPTERKVLLIDSILRNIDIPKLYFNRVAGGQYEVIDGQQRLWSIWEFLDDEFPYKAEGKGVVFSKLSPKQRKAIADYKFQITVFDDADDDYLRELFVRLQLGLILNAGERLNAAKGTMKDFVFNSIAKQKFIQSVGIRARRFSKETLAAQICINSFSRANRQTFSRTRYEDLQYFFSEYSDPQGRDLQFFNRKSAEILVVLENLFECFKEKARDLNNRSYILSIYLFFEELTVSKGDLSKVEQKTYSDFTFLLWKRLREESRLGLDRDNRELYSFQTLLSSAPGEAYQIERRHEKLTEYYEYFKRAGRIKGDPKK